MFGFDWPRFHAAVNDLPAALLFVTVLFDIAAWVTKRGSLKAAALWTLWAGVIGGWVAVLAGLQAEHMIEHGEAIHELMEQHERRALVTMGFFTVVLLWKLYRRFDLPRVEELVLRGLSVLGFIGLHGCRGRQARVRARSRRSGGNHEGGAGEPGGRASPRGGRGRGA
jgi:uncharacterized membrane protein